MLNNVILVGRLVGEPEVIEVNDKKVTNVVLAVNRNFKNADGIYDTDFINCVLWDGVASTTTEYCKKGDVIGVKGRLQTSKYEDKDHNTRYSMEVVAERVTFLSNRKDVDKTKENDDLEK